MSQQSKVKYGSVVNKYFVFNTSWGAREGEEHEKLIYYWNSKAADIKLADKISDCGLAEGVINFVTNFVSDSEDNCESLHALKSRFVFYQIETNYWSVISLSVPYSVLKTVEDGNQIIEYHNEEINDRFIKLMLKNIYQHFRLIYGPIDKLWLSIDKSREQLSLICDEFFDTIIPHIKLSLTNLIEVYSAIQYLPLDNMTFMTTQSFVNHVICTDTKCIKHSMFVYNDQLVCSSLTLTDTKIVYNYLINFIIPDVVREEISGQQTNKTRWIRKAFKVYLHETENKFYEMNLYRSINGATVILFCALGDNEELLSKCDALMCSRIVSLTSKLAEIAIKINGSNNLNSESVPNRDLFKFVYFNASNAAYKSNISSLFDHKKLNDSEFVKLVIDIESDLTNSLTCSNVYEIISKTTNDCWLVVHHSDSRTLYSMLNHKNANLIEATETVNALTCKQFKNILFVD